MNRTLSAAVLVALILSAEAPVLAEPQAALPVSLPTLQGMPLDAVLQEAMERNLDLLAERYSLSVSDARMITAKLRPNPVVSLGSIYVPIPGTNFQPNLSGVGPTEYNGRVDFLLERGGKRDSRIALAQADREYAEFALKNTARSLMLSVQSAFVDVQVAKENVQLATDNLRAFQAIVDINTARVAAGDLAKVELSRIRIAALQFQNAVQQTRLQLRQAKNRLQLLMGRRAPDDSFDVVGDLRRETLAQDVGQLSVLARERRPDLRSLQAAQARSQADMRLQIAQGKIDYTVGAQYSHQRVMPGTASSVSLFVSAPLPVFNRNQGEVARAEREGQQWAARLQALTTSVDTEVRSAFEQYRTNKDLLDNIETNMLNQAGEVRRTTEYSYRRGEASLVEFLDAQRAFNDTMQSYNQARADYARSLYLIDSITGRLEGPTK
ncbi:MAG: TolC family protein [Acidobacteria bacterium]|nr:TolC family protein [Acidobacteriota bacterium]